MRVLLFLSMFWVMVNDNVKADNQIIYLGGGCFWCVESVFAKVKGVLSATSGYMGGTIKNPAYCEVCNGNTGHAEVVRVVFNPDVISLEKILELFFTIHDPTTLNRQGNDVGTQYRSVIFYSTPAQKIVIDTFIVNLDNQEVFDNKIVTQVEAEKPFYEAEEYHQGYFNRNPDQPYCRIVVAPKVRKASKLFGELMK